MSERTGPPGELVVCLDEKPNLQALGRTISDLPLAPGYALRRDWEYVRHGLPGVPIARQFWECRRRFLGRLRRQEKAR